MKDDCLKTARQWLRWIVVIAALGSIPGCASLNAMMGGNSRDDAKSRIVWDFAKDSVVLEAAAQAQLNVYQGEAHTLMLGVYQMADTVAFQKLITDPVALAQSLGGGQGNENFLQYSRYVVDPGQHAILMIDRVQKTRFVGVVAGYYDLSGPASARLFEVPVAYSNKGMLSSTWTATPDTLALHMTFGADAIVNAQRLQVDPSQKKMHQALALPGGGKEIKLGESAASSAVQTLDQLKILED